MSSIFLSEMWNQSVQQHLFGVYENSSKISGKSKHFSLKTKIPPLDYLVCATDSIWSHISRISVDSLFMQSLLRQVLYF